MDLRRNGRATRPTAPSRRATVLVVGTAQPAGHAVVRSLARAGFRVVGARERARLAGRTRYCASTYVVPPARDVEPFLGAIDAICAEERVDVVVPLADETLGTLLRGRESTARWALAGPSREVFETLSDKHRLADTTRRAGLASPRQVAAGPDLPLEEIPALPAYVKIVSGFTEGRAAGRPIRVVDESECRATVGRIVAGGRAVVVQEEVLGERWRLHFARRGDVVHHVAARTLADYPPRTGQSTVSEFRPTPPLVAAAGTALLDAAGYQGVGSIQVILREGMIYPHDVNLRIPASVGGTIAAGLDMPVLSVEIALGEPLATATRASSNLRFVQLHGELAAFRDAVRGRDQGRSAVAIAKEIALGLVLPQRVTEPFDLRDPLPTLAVLADALGRTTRTRLAHPPGGAPS